MALTMIKTSSARSIMREKLVQVRYVAISDIVTIFLDLHVSNLKKKLRLNKKNHKTTLVSSRVAPLE